MSVHVDAVGQSLGHGTASWTDDDTILYALGVGAGGDPEADELSFTTENSHETSLRALPTLPLVVAGKGRSTPEPGALFRVAGDFDSARVVHGSQSLTLHASPPATGRATWRSHLTAIRDTGEHAVIETRSVLADPDTGARLAESTGALVVRGAGRALLHRPFPSHRREDGHRDRHIV